ncbi:MAG: histidine--tRNA ligase [Candidatus Binatus sp.]|uniref:histidine--tRNA ligase n=1 Tax=Candidatus Binatus sp. TaxID=2811406 RepID=UPI00271D0B96|nr:histidine--tRNA ligase [Candidatus Binatus sp.]MDO8433168.1 histidine--tRNA ligase [Candidatus Binatus sp.]
MDLQRLRGFNDLFGSSSRLLTIIENHARELMERYSIGEIRIPLLERIELYQRSTGETSDIVEKQMYAFEDKDERQSTVVLRPEGTPGVVRAYITAGFDRTQPEQRFYYSGPMFRRERPQKGRYRQFFQFGVEIFGREDAACDAELLILIDDFVKQRLIDATMEINSIGCKECRPAFRAALIAWGKSHWDKLCDDCHNRIERNPLRLLDCKIDAKLAETAPSSLDYLCEACRAHFGVVQELAAAAGVTFVVNPRMVRGLDYYTRTAFEVRARGLGSQDTIVAGGRYDGLVEVLGGASIPGIGFAIGLDRVALAIEGNPRALQALGSRLDLPREAATRQIHRAPVAAFVVLGEAAARESVNLARVVRAAGLNVEMLSPYRSIKSQLSQANSMGARFAVIVGDREIEAKAARLRDLRRHEEVEAGFASLVPMIEARLTK